MYYIYHIPGVKIGCTTQIDKRMKDQGFSNWEILETHEDGWHAGDRELELQKEYGYKVDSTHYMISRQNRIISHTMESRQKISNYQKGRPKSEQLKEKMRGRQFSEQHKQNLRALKKECPICGMVSNPGAIASHIKYRH